MHKNLKLLFAYSGLLGAVILVSACNGGGGSSSTTNSSSGLTHYLYSADTNGPIHQYQIDSNNIKLVNTLSDPNPSESTLEIKHDANRLYIFKENNAQNSQEDIDVYSKSITSEGDVVPNDDWDYNLVLLNSQNLNISHSNNLPLDIVNINGYRGIIWADTQKKLVVMQDLNDSAQTKTIAFESIGLANDETIKSFVISKTNSTMVQILINKTNPFNGNAVTRLALYKFVDTDSFLSKITDVNPIETGVVLDSAFNNKTNDNDVEYDLMTESDGFKTISVFDGTEVSLRSNSQDVLTALKETKIFDFSKINARIYASVWLFSIDDINGLNALRLDQPELEALSLNGSKAFDILDDLK